MNATRIPWCVIWVGLGLALGLGAHGAEAGTPFVDITETAGVAGPTAPGDTGGHGVMFADVDADGWPDLYVTMNFGHAMAELFYANLGGGRFEEQAANRGIDDYDGGSHGACFADLDNDGDYDLVNGTTLDELRLPTTNDVFQNAGDGHFRRVEGLPFVPAPTRAALTLDMDGDGDLDLFFVSGARGNDDPAEERNEAYRNDGGLHFTAVEAGDWHEVACGQGATDTDFDGDGDIDIIAANRTGEVQVLRNDGRGVFSRVPPETLGLRHPAQDGITMADVDNDGQLDMLLAGDNYGHLYRNTGDGHFVLRQSFHGTDGYMGGFADLDLDGDVDLVFAGGGQAWMNDGQGHFAPGPAVPLNGVNDPRAIAFADIDLDGDPDFALGCKRSGNRLIRNDLGHGNWLKVQVVSPKGQAGAYGAKVTVHADGALLGMREARSTNGYLGQDDPVLHFGLGNHDTVDVTVRFLGGPSVTKRGVAAGQEVTVKEE